MRGKASWCTGEQDAVFTAQLVRKRLLNDGCVAAARLAGIDTQGTSHNSHERTVARQYPSLYPAHYDSSDFMYSTATTPLPPRNRRPAKTGRDALIASTAATSAMKFSP